MIGIQPSVDCSPCVFANGSVYSAHTKLGKLKCPYCTVRYCAKTAVNAMSCRTGIIDGFMSCRAHIQKSLQ